MPDPIYYVYEKATGNFAGSGTVFYDDETYGCTEIAPPAQPASPELKYNLDTQTWAWWVPVS
jgi:hypothetical protein